MCICAMSLHSNEITILEEYFVVIYEVLGEVL